MLSHNFLLEDGQSEKVSFAQLKHVLCLLYLSIYYVEMSQEVLLMPSDIVAALLGWLIALVIFFGFIVFLRYIHYRERLAMITHGLDPNRLKQQRKSNRVLRAGLIISMVGLALSLGLYPIGFMLPKTFTLAPLHFGPWLLPGLIPLGVGAALIISYYLEHDAPPPPHTRDEIPIPSFKDPIEEEGHEEV